MGFLGGIFWNRTLGPNHSNKNQLKTWDSASRSGSSLFHWCTMKCSHSPSPHLKKNRCNKASLHFSGYARGEGVGAAFLSFAESTELARAELCGAAANQDGRSASLTAPNGPSQQAVIRRA